MWLRYDCGFVDMSQLDAERALRYLNGRDVMGFESGLDTSAAEKQPSFDRIVPTHKMLSKEVSSTTSSSSIETPILSPQLPIIREEPKKGEPLVEAKKLISTKAFKAIPLALKPKIATIRASNKVVPLVASIQTKLRNTSIASDLALYHGRRFKVGWTHANGLTILTTSMIGKQIRQRTTTNLCDISALFLAEQNFANISMDDYQQISLNVWSLLVTLWGYQDGLDEVGNDDHFAIMLRRQLFSKWIEDNVTDKNLLKRTKTQGRYLQNLLNLLTAHKVNEACELAFNNGDMNLSLLLAQTGGGKFVRALIAKQLQSWRETEADKFIDVHRLKAMMLVAGMPTYESSRGLVNIYENLDWLKSLAISVWYLCSPTASIIDALLKYDDATVVNACAPSPSHIKADAGSNMDRIQDIYYHILKLYSKQNHSLEKPLNPATHTSEFMDFRLSWLLLQVLENIGYQHCSEQSEAQLHVSFASQLENYGLWHWSIFALLHIPNNSQRELAIQQTLFRYIDLTKNEEYKSEASNRNNTSSVNVAEFKETLPAFVAPSTTNILGGFGANGNTFGQAASAFGAQNRTTSPFNKPPNTFGQSTFNQQPAWNLFGAKPFGAPTTAAATGFAGFGVPAANTTAPFGASKPFGQQQTGLFGQTPLAKTGNTFGFGTPALAMLRQPTQGTLYSVDLHHPHQILVLAILEIQPTQQLVDCLDKSQLGNFNQYEVSPKVSNALKINPVTTTLSKKSLFGGLEEFDSSIEESFSLEPNAKRLIIKPKVSPTPTTLASNSSSTSSVSVARAQKTSSSDAEERRSSQLPTTSLQIDNARRVSWLYSNLEKVAQQNRGDHHEVNTTMQELVSSGKSKSSNIDKHSTSPGIFRQDLNRSNNSTMQKQNAHFHGLNANDSILSTKSFLGDTNTDILFMSLGPHPTGIVLQRSDYYTIPPLNKLTDFMTNDGKCVVPNFTVGRKGYGNVYFGEPIDVAGLNLDELVHFGYKEVIIYPDDENKPPAGEGLNRKAQITLDQVWPHDKTLHEPIKDRERLDELNYEAKLRAVCDKHDTRFAEYRPETGSWVFKVDHFSKYGLSDSEEEEEIEEEEDLDTDDNDSDFEIVGKDGSDDQEEENSDEEDEIEMVGQKERDSRIRKKERDSRIRKKHKCHICGYIGKRRYHLKLHIERIHSQIVNKFLCPLCGGKIGTIPMMRVHMGRFHNSNKTPVIAKNGSFFFGKKKIETQDVQKKELINGRFYNTKPPKKSHIAASTSTSKKQFKSPDTHSADNGDDSGMKSNQGSQNDDIRRPITRQLKKNQQSEEKMRMMIGKQLPAQHNKPDDHSDGSDYQQLQQHRQKTTTNERPQIILPAQAARKSVKNLKRAASQTVSTKSKRRKSISIQPTGIIQGRSATTENLDSQNENNARNFEFVGVEDHLNDTGSVETKDDPETPETFVEKGNCFFQDKKFEAAIENYSMAIAMVPDNINFQIKRILCYLHLKNWEMLSKMSEEALEMDGTSVMLNFLYGIGKFQQRFYKEGLKYMTTAKELAKEQNHRYFKEIDDTLKTSNCVFHKNLVKNHISEMNMIELKTCGNILLESGEIDAALECYSKILEEDPKNVACYINRAICFSKRKKWEQVQENCSIALNLDSNSVKANYLLGESALELKQYDKAVEHLSRAYVYAEEQGRNFGSILYDKFKEARRLKNNPNIHRYT